MNNNECLICYENDSDIKIFNCGHIYHIKCINNSFKQIRECIHCFKPFDIKDLLTIKYTEGYTNNYNILKSYINYYLKNPKTFIENIKELINKNNFDIFILILIEYYEHFNLIKEYLELNQDMKFSENNFLINHILDYYYDIDNIDITRLNMEKYNNIFKIIKLIESRNGKINILTKTYSDISHISLHIITFSIIHNSNKYIKYLHQLDIEYSMYISIFYILNKYNELSITNELINILIVPNNMLTEYIYTHQLDILFESKINILKKFMSIEKYKNILIKTELVPYYSHQYHFNNIESLEHFKFIIDSIKDTIFNQSVLQNILCKCIKYCKVEFLEYLLVLKEQEIYKLLSDCKIFNYSISNYVSNSAIVFNTPIDKTVFNLLSNSISETDLNIEKREFIRNFHMVIKDSFLNNNTELINFMMNKKLLNKDLLNLLSENIIENCIFNHTIESITYLYNLVDNTIFISNIKKQITFTNQELIKQICNTLNIDYNTLIKEAFQVDQKL